MDKLGNMDNTVFSQTMDIDVDFDGNQSYQRKFRDQIAASLFASLLNRKFQFEMLICRTKANQTDLGSPLFSPATRMISMFGNHTFNFEDTEVTFEFTRYVQQLCSKFTAI